METITVEQLATRDLFLEELNVLLEQKQRELLEQYRQMNRIRRETGTHNEEYLELRRHYDYMIKKKEEQERAFSDIMDHLEKLKETEVKNNDMLMDIYEEQQRVLGEKDMVKRQINEIIEAENN